MAKNIRDEPMTEPLDLPDLGRLVERLEKRARRMAFGLGTIDEAEIERLFKEAATALQHLRAERDTYRALTIEAGRTGGGFLTDYVSLEFLRGVPEQVAACVNSFRSRAQSAEADRDTWRSLAERRGEGGGSSNASRAAMGPVAHPAPEAEPPAAGLSEAQIKHMVSRFLGWRLPEDFRPDNGISFTPEHSAEFMASLGKAPMKHDPVGTNLFSADQARAMVLHMIEGLS